MKEYEGEIVKILCTSKCNIKCDHCLVRYNGERDQDELLEIVKLLKNKYKVLMNGAEVLTNLGYLKAYKEVGQTWIMTNGLELLNPDVIAAIKENNIKSVSLSYHFGMHDDISKVKTDQIKKIIEVIKKNDLEFRFLTTISSLNYQLIVPMCQEAYDIGARGIMFTNLIRQGNGVNLDNHLFLSQEQINEFFNYLRYVRSIYKKDDFIIERSGTFGKDEESLKNNFSCNCGTNRVYLSPDNKIYPCVFLTGLGCEIGMFIDGKIMIYDDFYHDESKCAACEICNNGKSFSKVLQFSKK